MKTLNRRNPWSSGMEGEKCAAFLFSRRLPDFCVGRRWFPTNENSNIYRRDVGAKLLGSGLPIIHLCTNLIFFGRIFHFPPNSISWETGTIWARSIQPKFQPVRPGKVVHLKRWTRFFETFPVGPNRSIEFGPKFPEILVEWIAPYKSKRAPHNISRFCLIQLPVFLCLLLLRR